MITAGWSFAFEELGERAVAGPFVSVQLTVNTAGRVSTDGSWCRPPCRGAVLGSGDHSKPCLLK